jgi:hypothetical protein
MVNKWDEVEAGAFELCRALGGQYEWSTEPWREKSQELILALLTYFNDYNPAFAKELNDMFLGAVEDARLGRGEAEVQNLHRDELARQKRRA